MKEFLKYFFFYITFTGMMFIMEFVEDGFIDQSALIGIPLVGLFPVLLIFLVDRKIID